MGPACPANNAPFNVSGGSGGTGSSAYGGSGGGGVGGSGVGGGGSVDTVSMNVNENETEHTTSYTSAGMIHTKRHSGDDPSKFGYAYT